MKNKVAKTSLIAGALIISASTFAQKKNETSAAVEFKNKYQMSMASGDVEGAKKALIAAKGFIDLAAEHVETKESPKTLYYKGEIYANFLMVGMQTMDTTFMKIGGEDALEVAIAAYKKGFDVSDKFDGDIKDAVYQKKAMLDPYANMLYKNNMFKEAGELYMTQADLSSAVSELDSTSIFNGSLCFERK
jgi:hypothetical protein